MPKSFVRNLLVALGLATLTLTAPSFAQEVPKPEDQPATEKTEQDEGQPLLDEITVTAQKRIENQKDVPSAVTAVPAETLNVISQGGADVKALSGRVPSLIIESSFGRMFPRFYIRGLGNTDFDLNASQPVSMVYDDVVLENPVVKGMPVWDIDQVEVLRGPQGTLFGRNTPAGVVKFESKKPSQDKEGYVQGSWGTFNTADLQGAIGGGITDTLSARVSFLYQAQDDWVDNEHNGSQLGGYNNWAFRTQFLWEPQPRFKALFNFHAWDVDGTARIFRANMIEHGSNHIVPGFDQRKVYQDGLNEQQISSQGGVLKLDYAFDTGTLTSVTGLETLDMYSRGDIDGGYGASFAPPYGPGFIPFSAESADGMPNLDQFTEELRFASNLPGKFQYLVGAFYFDEDLKAETFSYVSLAPGNPIEGYAFQKQRAKSWALFGSVDLAATEKWKLKAGLRYTHDEKDFSAERPMPLGWVPNTATTSPIRANTDDDFANWDLSATYILSPDANLYGRIATGSRAPSIQGRILFAPDTEGGTNPATNGVSVADTEDVFSVEVGAKTELMDKRLRLNGDIYHYTVDGQQLTAVGGQYNIATILNADKTTGYGFESDIEFAMTRQWHTTIGLSYNHTEIDDPNLTVGACAGGCTMLDPLTSNGKNAYVDGNPLPHAPEWIITGILDFRQTFGAGQFLSAFDWSYYSDKQFFLYESEEFHGDGLELGLRFGYEWNQAKYRISAYGRNIADEVIVQNGVDFNNLTGMTNDPANWGLEFRARF